MSIYPQITRNPRENKFRGDAWKNTRVLKAKNIVTIYYILFIIDIKSSVPLAWREWEGPEFSLTYDNDDEIDLRKLCGKVTRT